MVCSSVVIGPDSFGSVESVPVSEASTSAGSHRVNANTVPATAMAANVGTIRRRVAAAVSIGLGGLGGGILAAGALLVQRHASAGDWVLAVGALALLMPVHIRVLLGPFGLKDSRLLAEEAPGA